MAQRTGTHSFADLLTNRFQSVADYGVDNIAPALQTELDSHNRVMEQIVTELCEVSADVQRVNGSGVGGAMQRADEFAVNPTQKAQPGAEVAFPLEKFEYPLGWTREFFLRATPADMAIMQQNAQIAHRREVIAQFRRAFFGSSNYTFVDELGKVRLNLTVRRFWNADGSPIPAGPTGETYDGSTVTHYTAEATLSATGLTAAIDNVALKSNDAGMVRVAISKTNEAAVRLLTGFEGAVDSRFLPSAQNNDPRQPLVISTPLNRLIGYFAGAEVWVKPWATAGYAAVYDAGASDKPLVMRVDPSPALRGLVVAAELPGHPLYARVMEARFGFGANNRGAGAVHEFGVDGTYTDPAFVA